MAKSREPKKTAGSDSESDDKKDSSSEESVESGSESGEEEDSSSEESGSQEPDSEPEQTQVTKIPSYSIPAAAKKPQLQSASKPQQPPSSSSSDDEESESEPEPKSDVPDPELRSVATNSEGDSQKFARKSRSKPSAAESVTPTKSAGVKRPAEEKETEVQDKKKKKSKKNTEPEISEKKSTNSPKKALFQRLWSEEDEIVILRGMIDYWAKKKTDPVANLSAFHESIKKNLHVGDVTKSQLQDKIRRLKKKYQNNKSKEKDGKERTFPKPHEQEAYELSKSIWGKENVSENGISLRKEAIKRAYAGTDNDEPKDAKAVDAAGADVQRVKRAKLIGATVEERVLMIGTEMFEENVRGGDDGAEEWNKLRIEEMEVYLRQLEVKSAQARVVIQRLKSEGK